MTVNYRLNLFGFLAHPELTEEQPETPANFGHLDQRAGLLWVINNIKNFGGDLEHITMAGQSAGGMSVMVHLTNPSNMGLFKGAIVQSALIRSPYPNDFFGHPISLVGTCLELFIHRNYGLSLRPSQNVGGPFKAIITI